MANNQWQRLWIRVMIAGMNWASFRGHFAIYFVTLLAIGVGRMILGQTLADGTQLAVVVMLSVPAAASAAFFACRQKPHIEGTPIPKPRIVRSILIGLAIPAIVLILAWALLRE